MHVWTKTVARSTQGRSSLTCIQFIRHTLVVFAVLHFLFLLLLLKLLFLPLGELPLEAGVLLRGLGDEAGLVYPPEQEPALPVVMVPAQLHQQRLLIEPDPPLPRLVNLKLWTIRITGGSQDDR